MREDRPRDEAGSCPPRRALPLLSLLTAFAAGCGDDGAHLELHVRAEAPLVAAPRLADGYDLTGPGAIGEVQVDGDTRRTLRFPEGQDPEASLALEVDLAAGTYRLSGRCLLNEGAVTAFRSAEPAALSLAAGQLAEATLALRQVPSAEVELALGDHTAARVFPVEASLGAVLPGVAPEDGVARFPALPAGFTYRFRLDALDGPTLESEEPCVVSEPSTRCAL